MTATLEEKQSTHAVEIVPVELIKHPDADLLSIIPAYGYTYVGRTEDWAGVRRAAYIPPDSVVDTKRPEFAFLADQCKTLDSTVRIKARRLRGVVSFGLMVPVPDDTPLGEDWAEKLGVTHYEPPLAHEQKAKGRGYTLGGEETAPPAIRAPKYDLDAFRRHHALFVPGEPVVVTEKLDGANARYTYVDGQMYCGSRERWTREFADYSHVTVDFLLDQGCSALKAVEIVGRLHDRPPMRRNIWWQALQDEPTIEAFCRRNPGSVLYGEIFGDVNCIKYGLGGNRFAAFDVLRDGAWLDPVEMFENLYIAGIPTAPVLTAQLAEHGDGVTLVTPYDFDEICAMAEGPTRVGGAKPGTLREGVVVAPIDGRCDPRFGRVKMKVVSAAYLERYR